MGVSSLTLLDHSPPNRLTTYPLLCLVSFFSLISKACYINVFCATYDMIDWTPSPSADYSRRPRALRMTRRLILQGPCKVAWAQWRFTIIRPGVVTINLWEEKSARATLAGKISFSVLWLLRKFSHSLFYILPSWSGGVRSRKRLRGGGYRNTSNNYTVSILKLCLFSLSSPPFNV